MGAKDDVSEALRRIHGDPGRISLAVCVPSGAHWSSAFGMSLALFFLYYSHHRVPGFLRQTVGLINVQSSLLHAARQRLVEEALIELHATHILFVDSDQSFPPEVVHILAASKKKVVGANVVTRMDPMLPCAVGLDGKKLWTRPDSHGIEEVSVCGTGVMLIDTRVFGEIEKPFFLQVYGEESGFVGEDVYFCRSLREKGIKVYVDHDLSKKVGHFGEARFDFSRAWESES